MLGMTVSGCAALGWYGQAIGGQLDLLSRREHIASLIADPATDPELREKLRSVIAIREFAVVELELPDSRSYRHYADLERGAVVWNVVASERYEIKPRTWCYPVAGCLPYRGYFRRANAEAEAARLRGAGLDVIIAPATAYSTLGWFADPVLNTMLAWDEATLAGFLFHELSHEKLFVPGAAEFNEAYATLLEQVGVERWLSAQGRESELAEWREQREVNQALVAELLATRAHLQRRYAEPVSEAIKEHAKQEAFAGLVRRLSRLAGQSAQGQARQWVERDWNNADLVLAATYEQGLAALARLLDDCDGQMACFHSRAAAWAARSEAERTAFLRQTENND